MMLSCVPLRGRAGSGGLARGAWQGWQLLAGVGARRPRQLWGLGWWNWGESRWARKLYSSRLPQPLSLLLRKLWRVGLLLRVLRRPLHGVLLLGRRLLGRGLGCCCSSGSPAGVPGGVSSWLDSRGRWGGCSRQGGSCPRANKGRGRPRIRG